MSDRPTDLRDLDDDEGPELFAHCREILRPSPSSSTARTGASPVPPSGPFGSSQFWSSDAPDGAPLYTITGVVDEWDADDAADYGARGFTHYHDD